MNEIDYLPSFTSNRGEEKRVNGQNVINAMEIDKNPYSVVIRGIQSE